MQIIILGMHRSGTSMLARLINMLGVYIGPENMMLEQRAGRINKSNARGHWERFDVMDLNDAMLGAVQAKWDSPIGSSSLNLQNLSEPLRQRLELLVYGLDAHRPWLVKDPRLCLTLPCWLPVLDVPVCVMMYRNPLEVAQSLLKRNKMPLDKGLALWEFYITQALNHSMHLPRIWVSQQAMLENPVRSTQELLQGLRNAGVRRLEMPHDKEILSFVKPSLASASANPPKVALNASQQYLVQLMQHGLPQLEPIQCSQSSLNILSASSRA